MESFLKMNEIDILNLHLIGLQIVALIIQIVTGNSWFLILNLSIMTVILILNSINKRRRIKNNG